MKVTINQATAIAGGAIILASISHGHNQTVTAADFHRQIQHDTKHNMMAVANSFTVVDQGPYRTIVRGAVVPTVDVIPFHDGQMNGFKSISASIYEDENDNMWSLKQEANGKYLVRANNVDNASEIEELMKSLCSSPVPGSDNCFFTAVASAQQDVQSVAGGEFALYLQEGNLTAGIVLASLNADGEEGLYVLDAKGQNLDLISVAQVLNHKPLNETINGLSLQIPEHLQAEASSAGETIEKLVNFYQKVYGFNRTYFDKFEAIIRGHAWA